MSALKRYTQQDFLKLVEKHRISWHEKTLGQLFCDNSAKDIIRMLLAELEAAGGTLQLETDIKAIEKPDDRFSVSTSRGRCGRHRLLWRPADRRSPRWARPASAMIWPSASATT